MQIYQVSYVYAYTDIRITMYVSMYIAKIFTRQELACG